MNQELRKAGKWAAVGLAGILPASGSAGETPAGLTGKMPVPRCSALLKHFLDALLGLSLMQLITKRRAAWRPAVLGICYRLRVW
jgi:hypothetical protein